MTKTFPPVLTKRDFARRYKHGEFGNASPTWDRLEDVQLRKNAYYNIRNRVIGGLCVYEIPSHLLKPEWVTACIRCGAANLYISEMAPHDKQLIQGEVRRSERYFDLRYTTVKKPMRDALREQEYYADGVEAVELLKRDMCPNSWEWLNVLFGRYPDHVVEFTSFSCCWGTLPRYNTVFWETRRY